MVGSLGLSCAEAVGTDIQVSWMVENGRVPFVERWKYAYGKGEVGMDCESVVIAGMDGQNRI